jgi:hypothetical protein
MFLQESRHDVGSEGEGDSTVILTPSRDILIGVRPEQVAEKAAVRDLQLVRKVDTIAEPRERWFAKRLYSHRLGA